MNAGARWGIQFMLSFKQTYISTRLWLHLELKVIWEAEVEDLNLLHASALVSLLKSRNKLSCLNTPFKNTSSYFIVNSKYTLKINFMFLTHPHHKPFIPISFTMNPTRSRNKSINCHSGVSNPNL